MCRGFVRCGGRLLQLLQNIGEGTECAAEDAVDIGDGDAVIGNGYALLLCAADAVLHLLFVQHARAAVDYELIPAQIFGKACAAGPFKLRLCAGKFFNPGGQLDCADVAALAVVCAAFAD